MKRALVRLGVVISAALLLLPARALADPPSLAVPAGLSLAEIKVTGNEFMLLENNTGSTIADLSAYWLYNFNNVNPLASGVSSSTQQLPSASLADGQTVLLSSTGGLTCGAAVTAKLSISLTDSGGFLEVVAQSLVNNVLIQTAGDAVSWSSGTNSTPGMITNVPSNTSDPQGAYYRYASGGNPSFLWQKADVDTTNSCQMDVSSVSASTAPDNFFSVGSPPPAVIVSSDSSSSGSIPAADLGLAAPIVNEVLPNPAPPATDDEDEFVELYNSNPTSFDLSGFTLEVGTTTLHDYTFPSGTSIGAKSFEAFFSGDTNLSMSNSSGQVKLLDPLGNIISQSDPYSSAKDGQAWALAGGKWYWTTTPTPNEANKVAQPASSSKSTKKAGVTTSSLASLGASTSSSGSSAPAAAPAPLHAWTLAGVGGAALLYAGYEYRTDLANNLYRLRRYAQARRTAGK